MTEDYLVRCPYYLYDRDRAVCCEGFCDGAFVSTVFRGVGSKRGHKKKFCRAKWAACPLAQAQNSRYDYVPPR